MESTERRRLIWYGILLVLVIGGMIAILAVAINYWDEITSAVGGFVDGAINWLISSWRIA